MAIALVAAAALAMAPGASAGTARLDLQRGDERTPDFESFRFEAAPGEANRLTVASDGGAIVVSDSVDLTLGRGCARVGNDPKRARCTSPAQREISGGHAELGDGDDRGSGGAGVALAGGAGDDVLDGGTLFGGPGSDALTGNDVKGGPGADTLTTPDKAGNDPYSVIDESDRGNGSDVIRGGRGRDYLRYSGRVAPLRVDLRRRDGAGEAGENDRVTGVEHVDGGSGDDVLIGTRATNDLSGGGGSDRISGLGGDDNLYGYDIANAGTRRNKDRIDGGDGDDDIGGSNGPDVLKGGSGRDTVSAGGGNDRIAVRDRSTDVIGCGRARRDSVTADALDFVPAGCERVRRKGAARAVPLRSVVGSQDDDGPGVEIGCSVDGPRTCRGSVRLYARGRLQGTRRFRARRGARGFVSFPRRLRRLEGRRVRIVVRAPDRRGRGRTVVLRTTVETEG